MASRMGLIGCLVIVVALLKCATAHETQIDYQVGDSFGWAVPPNTSYYSTWASTKTFYLGDSFSFNWTGPIGNQNVVPVSKPYYDNCTEGPGIIYALPVTYTPPSTGTYYFICITSDHCERGQKIAITILPAVGSPKSSASSLTVGAFFAVLSTTAVISFLTFV
ncbi:Blue copper protein [Morella rubra]|uniref:Blue copper protein n=1 Tax=Morella rubra TaxID=262757 RepID=A0A6A1UGK6_9ROSI|nr:Blue copper protein [Morella rubra]